MNKDNSEKKYNELNIQQKVAVLKKLSDGKSARSLAKEYSCSPSQICNIKKRKLEIMDSFEANIRDDKQRIKIRKTNTFEINDLMW